MKITDCIYGKGGCRVLKVLKSQNVQNVLDLNTKVLLHGKDFSVAYESDNNASLIPTDTVKNIVFAKAKDWTFYSPEEFAINLVKFFINEYAHVEAVSVSIKQTPWERIDGHLKEKHSFVCIFSLVAAYTYLADSRCVQVQVLQGLWRKK